MDGHNTSTDDMLQTLLVRTAVMQSQQETMLAVQKAMLVELVALRDGQAELRGSAGVVQAEVKALNEKLVYYATEAQVESVRTEVHKSINAQTLRLFIWLTSVCSGLAVAAYHIARNIH
jgi:hypothetical protein